MEKKSSNDLLTIIKEFAELKAEFKES